MSQDTERLSDTLVANLATYAADAKPTTREVESLAREVRASRKLVADLRAIPMQDDGDPYDPYADAYNDALRGVAHMIDEAAL